MSQVPKLSPYLKLIQSDSKLQTTLSISSCNASPGNAFITGIVEPLETLAMSGQISTTEICLVILDGLCEAEYHRPDYGDTIGSFISKHISRFPPWMKIICTVRTSSSDFCRDLPFKKISLDSTHHDERLEKDMSDFILSKVNNPSSKILSNINSSSSRTGNGNLVDNLVKHLVASAQGCFLYVNLILSLLEKRNLAIKSASFKVLPQSLAEIYQLIFNIRFPSSQSYEQMKDIISISLASLKPLKLSELFNIYCALQLTPDMDWNQFQQRFQSISDFLVTRSDDSLMIFHPTLRDWLLSSSHSNNRFKCDIKLGHYAIASYLARTLKKLKEDKILQLVHHLLKSGVYKTDDINSDLKHKMLSKKDFQAYNISLTDQDITSALGCFQNIYSPMLKVSQILLLSGADPNYETKCLDQSPLLGVYSHLGNLEMVSLLLQFSVDVDKPNQGGDTPLSLACRAGHKDIVQLLLQQNAVINKVNLHNKLCPLVVTAEKGHLDIIELLLSQEWPGVDKTQSHDWPSVDKTQSHDWPSVDKTQSQDWSSVDKKQSQDWPSVDKKQSQDWPSVDKTQSQDWASVDTTQSQEWLSFDKLTNQKLVNVNKLSRQASQQKIGLEEAIQQSITAAISHKNHRVSELLLNLPYTDINSTDSLTGLNPLSAAAKSGDRFGMEMVLKRQPNIFQLNLNKEAAIHVGAKEGHWDIVDCLLKEGADVNQCDGEGRTPVMLAAAEGKTSIVELLLSYGANLKSEDQEGVTPIGHAIINGHCDIVDYLLFSGDNVNNLDRFNRSLLELAVNIGNIEMVKLLLDHGANMDIVDQTGIRLFDRAIKHGDKSVISVFLDKGASLGSATWIMADGKSDVQHILIDKLLVDGNMLYKRGDIIESAQRLSLALRQVQHLVALNDENRDKFQELQVQILLQLSRCERQRGYPNPAVDLATTALVILHNQQSSPGVIAEALVIRAKAFKSSGKLAEALTDFCSAQDINPEISESPEYITTLKNEINTNQLLILCDND